MRRENPTYDFLQDGEDDVNPNLTNRNGEARINTVVESYLNYKELDGLSSATIGQYKEILGYFMDFLDNDMLVEDITADVVRDYMKYLLDNGIKITTIAIRYRVLRAFFNWLVDKDAIEKAPTDDIKEPKTPNKYPYVLDEDQMKKLVKVTRDRLDRWSGIRNRTIILLMLDVGLRSEEVRTAKLEDLNLDDNSLKVNGKGAKDRRVFFGELPSEWLGYWTEVRNDIEAEINTKTIFIDLNGHQIKKRNLSRIIDRLQKRAGLEDTKVSPHVLRHTAATMAVKNGLDVYSLQQMMGHEQLKTSMRYVHMSGRRLKEATKKTSPMDHL
ncbi:tyrosine-type recombinase/integrase [Candidatus Bipolaricaulota bacterium]|nr:tyrosine-type recombinase/integrase [Candidatus Bipolaricaulota bacterium]